MLLLLLLLLLVLRLLLHCCLVLVLLPHIYHSHPSSPLASFCTSCSPSEGHLTCVNCYILAASGTFSSSRQRKPSSTGLRLGSAISTAGDETRLGLLDVLVLQTFEPPHHSQSMAPSRAPDMRSTRAPIDSADLEGSGDLHDRSQLPVEDEEGYYQSPPRTRPWSRILDSLRFMSVRHRYPRSYRPARTNPISSAKSSEPRSNSSYLPRPATIWVLTKQICLVFPILALILL